MIIMNSSYQFSPFSIDLNQDHQHYINAHYFTTTTSPSSSSSSPLPYHIFINNPPPPPTNSGEDTDPTNLDYSWGPPPPSFHQYQQPPLLLQTGSSCMYDGHEMVEVADHDSKMEKEMSSDYYTVVAPKLRIMNQTKKKKKLTIKTNLNVNDAVQSPSTLQLPTAAAMTDNTTTITTTSSNSPTAGSPTVRVCSDCNTTKTPLWRSGPQGPKSLCNACGIRQRKARRAMAAAIADGTTLVTTPPSTTIKLKTSSSSLSSCKKEMMTKKTKKKRNNNNLAQQPSSNNSHLPLKKRRKFTAARKIITDNTISDGVCSNYNNPTKVCFDDLAAIFNNNNNNSSSVAYQRVFPQDEKEAAILLMALSCGMVHT